MSTARAKHFIINGYGCPPTGERLHLLQLFGNKIALRRECLAAQPRAGHFMDTFCDSRLLIHENAQVVGIDRTILLYMGIHVRRWRNLVVRPVPGSDILFDVAAQSE